VTIQEAKTDLSRLVEQATGGEDVVIAQAGRPMDRLRADARAIIRDPARAVH
jgi:antitoxin (DNA-binding transcriptional repressor) of toxin-antitoxin stability system